MTESEHKRMSGRWMFYGYKKPSRDVAEDEIASLPSTSGDLADAANLVFRLWSHPLFLSAQWSTVSYDETLSWTTLEIYIHMHIFLSIIFLLQATYEYKVC